MITTRYLHTTPPHTPHHFLHTLSTPDVIYSTLVVVVMTFDRILPSYGDPGIYCCCWKNLLPTVCCCPICPPHLHYRFPAIYSHSPTHLPNLIAVGIFVIHVVPYDLRSRYV